MIDAKAYAEDAIHVYMLAIAYFNNARISEFSLIGALDVKEKWVGVFSIWRQEQSSIREEPVAVCTYREATRTWKIELSRGKQLTLIDNGNVWDILWDKNASRQQLYSP